MLIFSLVCTQTQNGISMRISDLFLNFSYFINFMYFVIRLYLVTVGGGLDSLIVHYPHLKSIEGVLILCAWVASAPKTFISKG